ncbi:MAG TPA: hypothetical protein VNN08_25615 [Thermoanaerobaculia bacterium]|nr:hypothetical protein [Thermoanaerobaculia bacterium]
MGNQRSRPCRPGNADLSDARVIFQSEVGLGVYASVVDNSTTDPTYFVAMSPSGF